jgi:hypothetical protein
VFHFVGSSLAAERYQQCFYSSIGFLAIAKSNGNRVKRVLEERINPKDNLVDPIDGVPI